MTAEELERTIGKREMARLEFKESFGAECIETACAFANAAGGYVVIGVDDCGAPSKNQNGSPYPEWKEADGGFLTTYQIRDKKVEAIANGGNQRHSSGVNERADEMSGVALKTALKTALKDDDDAIVAKILAVYKEIANNTTIPLSAVAEKVGLSARTVDEYVGIMKSASIIRRKGGRKFGEWEILTIDNLGGAHV